MQRLLLVEDNDDLREQMKWALNDAYEVIEAANAAACIDMVKQHAPSLVCLDMGLDNIPERGRELIDEMLLIDRRIKIVVITAHTSETLGNESIGRGAFDYLKKPVDIDKLRVILERAVRLVELEGPVVSQTDAAGLESMPDFFMVGSCPAMKNIFSLITRLSPTDVNVLITGDSGTGKELCARAIHYHSQRQGQPFVPINCGAIPENLLESELFGYEKGAFTGAQTSKKGLIESADKGTLFLDEIGDMPRALQVKLLRFLEDQSFQRLGDTAQYKADVRIIAATNKRDLAGEDAPMRSDLYYRLSEFEIKLPPLRERGEDILVLAEKIVERNRNRFNLPRLKLSSRSRKLLLQYSWPGNVRELENKLSRAALTCRNQVIEQEDLQLSANSFENLPLKEARAMFEREYIINILRQNGFKIAPAAQKAGVSRPTFYDLMKRHDIAVKLEAKLSEQ